MVLSASRAEESPDAFAPLQLLPFMEATSSHLHLLFSGLEQIPLSLSLCLSPCLSLSVSLSLSLSLSLSVSLSLSLSLKPSMKPFSCPSPYERAEGPPSFPALWLCLFVCIFLRTLLMASGCCSLHALFPCCPLLSITKPLCVSLSLLSLCLCLSICLSSLFLCLSLSVLSPFAYPPDGLLFEHKLSPHIGGSSPFVICWRDARISYVERERERDTYLHATTLLLSFLLNLNL